MDKHEGQPELLAETDRRLLDRYCQVDDEDAFQEILTRHEGWVRRQCQVRLQNQVDADDATQAVFVLLSRKAPDIRDGGALAAWLQRALHGITSNMLKAKATRRRHDSMA